MQLSEARALACALGASAKPFVQRGMIAGSIRRQKPEVKDIELVVIPRWSTVTVADLFGEKEEAVNLLYTEWSRWITDPSVTTYPRVQWIKPSVPGIVPWHVQPEGKYWRGYLPQHGVKLDIFIATPTTYGTIAIMRTGSADFSAGMFAAAKRAGYQNVGGELHRFGRQVPVPEEEDAFRLLGVEWVAPQDRTGSAMVRPVRPLRGGQSRT